LLDTVEFYVIKEGYQQFEEKLEEREFSWNADDPLMRPKLHLFVATVFSYVNEIVEFDTNIIESVGRVQDG
jgi:hypothetical protein